MPFVPASGGHSPWSTIDENGFILDLSLCKNVVVNSATNTVTVTGGILSIHSYFFLKHYSWTKS